MAIPSAGYDSATISNPSSALTDFSLIIDLSRMSSSWWADVNTSDGTRGRAAKNDGTTELATDWIDFDNTGETGILRVKWSGTLAASGTQIIRIYAPNTRNTAYGVNDTYGQYAAYDSNWALYLPSGGGNDRTTNQQNTTAFGSPTIGGVTGQIGVATNYSSTQYSDTDSNVTGPTNDGSIFAWIQDPPTPGYSCGAGFNDLSIRNESFGSGRGYFRLANGDTEATFDGAASISWRHYAGISTTSTATLYVNNSGGTSQAATNTIGSNVLTIGDRASGFGGTETTIGEFQLHSVARSTDWLDEEYDQTSDQSTFWGTWSWTSTGTTYNETIAETFNVTDAISDALVISRSIAETMNLSDAIAPATVISATIAESANFSDAAASTLNLSFTIDETLSITDQIASVAEYNIAIAETLQLTDEAVTGDVIDGKLIISITGKSGAIGLTGKSGAVTITYKSGNIGITEA